MIKSLTKLSFEKSLERLEEIVKNLEKGNVELENAINLYEEGILLQEHCQKKLNTAKMKITKIVNKNGEISTEKLEI
ncbi:MAG: exodeoxyribonuclease VII small subunit [Candidatus Midichloriaceae bacterium]|jgi:exodeoxyribonuclease VII small subunit